ncbi:hypothetical protein G7B21_29405, partial [Klebsiella pneumoniae]|nr:hypothetical protein [Klebsiella pneumoniae]
MVVRASRTGSGVVRRMTASPGCGRAAGIKKAQQGGHRGGASLPYRQRRRTPDDSQPGLWP